MLAAREVTAPAVASSKPSAVLATFPHDVTSFTEGMLYDHGVFYESTGLYGESKLRKVDLITGARPRTGEARGRRTSARGLALLAGRTSSISSPTENSRCFVYDAATLEKKTRTHVR